jgi:hypothetical protein
MEDLEVVQLLVAGDVPRSPRSVNPDVPKELDAICVKALAHKATDRYATAQEFRDDLEQYLMDTGLIGSARRQIPSALDTLFKDKRAEIRAIIEKQLQSLDENPDGALSAVAMPVSVGAISSRSVTGPSPVGEDDTSDEDEEVDGEEGDEEEEQAPAGPGRAVLVAAVLLAVFLVGGAVVIGLKNSVKQSIASPVAEINVRINATPPTAMVKLDDGPLSPVPFGQTVQKDGHQHRVHVEAAGYQPKNDLVVFSQDMILSFDLVKETGTAPTSSTAPSAAPSVAIAPDRHGPVGGGTRPVPSHLAAGRPSAGPSETAPHPPPVETAPPVPSATAATATPVATTAAPPAGDVAGEYRKAVNRAIRPHAGEVQACFDRAKVSTPQLAGTVTVGASLTPAGTVSSARVANSTVHGLAGPGATMLEQCLVERFKTWTFPAVPPGASSEISYVFRFE